MKAQYQTSLITDIKTTTTEKRKTIKEIKQTEENQNIESQRKGTEVGKNYRTLYGR